MNRTRIMMLIFIGSEAIFFLSLIISYVYYSFPGGILSPTAEYLNIKHALFFTAFLLASSLTIELANKKLKKQQTKSLLIWLFITIVLGLVFLTGQMLEYYSLYQENVTVNKNVFGSAFFTLTGFHGFHVLVGLIVLAILWFIIYTGNYKGIENEAFEGTAMYWHFVDAVWVAVFTVIYIGAILL